jgi:2,4-dienoyl-CoA reductase-like NADH-dependent reductase (Old Yellow Enzyme family)
MALEKLFSPYKIRGVTIPNRIVSTGHDTVMAHHGHVTDRLIAYHEERAKGGAGLIIVQVAGVHETARYTSHMLMADDDTCIEGYRALAQKIHAQGTKIFGQLFHPGREIMETDDGTAPVAYAPSAVPNSRFGVMPAPLDHAMIKEIIEGYAASALRLKQAGLDGCEIVASHGYLPAQFLNPAINQREDEYGGSLENRMRFIKEIATALRMRDAEAIDQNEVIAVCAALDQSNAYDYYHVIAGTSASLQGAIHIVPPMYYETAYVAPFASKVKARVNAPLMVTGRINQPQIAEQILSEGRADFCGMTRALIADPEMPNKARGHRLDDIRACIACNQACIGHFHKGYPISCIQYPETGRELTLAARKTPTKHKKKILIAGGGPAGMKAASVLATRGHHVTLCEASSQLGGQALLAQMLPGRAEFGGIITNLAREMELAGVDVRRLTQVTRALIEQERPGAVIIATGATARRPQFEGSDSAHCVTAWQVLKGEVNIGGRVVIAEWKGDWIGMGVAEKLAREGRKVTLATEMPMAGQALPFYVRDEMVARLHRLGVEIMPYARLYGADDETIYFHHASSGEAIMIEGVETLVLSQGHSSVHTLKEELNDIDITVHMIGDALTPRTAEEAVLDGLKLAVSDFYS